MDKLHIREASVNDFASLHRLYTYVDQNHSDAHPEQFKPSSEIKRPDTYLEKILSDESIKVLVACAENEIIGFIHAELKK